ncbi:MAG: two-component sensor histidine kinase [Selenomonadales bacterium]|nr:two-component sensor histidine kinase [Selenomonadales bacterium]
MTGKILQSILSVATAVLIASLIVITGVLYQYFGTMQESQLKDELKVVAAATEQLGERYLRSLNSDRYRLTWVDADGTVRFDSHADAATMENHAEREEIKEALAFGLGSSTRQSSTLTEQTIYEATRLNDGSILRISVSRATAFVLVLGMIPPIAVIMVIAIMLSAWLARRMAKKVVEPLNNLNLEKPMENQAYAELSPLLYRIHTQHLEIKNQIQTLKQKQDEFDQIIGNMKESLVLLDSAGKVISINPAARSLFDTDVDCIGEDFLTVDRKTNMRHALNEAKEQGHADFRANIKGREYQVDLTRIDSDGNEQGMVILAFDITEQVNAERNRREFTANVSHELKTPLQSIIGSAELMENGIVKEEDIPRFVGRIRQEASRLVSLIDNIIRLSQLDEKTELLREDVSLRLLAEEVCETLSDAAKMKNVSLKVSGDDGVVNGVHRLLYEIVYNLCDNAIKYNHLGGSVNISVQQNANEVWFIIQDTGIGISPEHHDKIFERFYRVDKSHSKQSGGTGLGLSIVKHAVQYHHGKIFVNSTLNKGSTISVVFYTKI